MSFVISLKTQHGFVMGADSRMTVSYDDGTPDWITDTYQKIFLAPNNIGVIVCGTLNSVNGEPIMKELPKFFHDNCPENNDLDVFSSKLHKLSTALYPNTIFVISGYKNGKPLTYSVNSTYGIQDKSNFSSSFYGDYDIADNLLNKTDYKIPYEHFTLEDGKEFIQHIYEVTKRTMKFQSRKQTVGGKFNRLIITPKESYFVDEMLI